MFYITPDDFSGSAIRALLEEHFAGMLSNSPEGSCHFLDFDGLNAPDVTFWSIWTSEDPDAELMGCGALKAISDSAGEVKSMRTHGDHLRKGVGTKMLEHIIKIAQQRGYKSISLETGSGEAFDAAHGLYLRYGFEYCGPFADYTHSDFSKFMTLKL